MPCNGLYVHSLRINVPSTLAADTGNFAGLRVDDEGIERRHCLIRLQDRQFHMQDHCIHLIGLLAIEIMPGLMIGKHLYIQSIN